MSQRPLQRLAGLRQLCCDTAAQGSPQHSIAVQQHAATTLTNQVLLHFQQAHTPAQCLRVATGHCRLIHQAQQSLQTGAGGKLARFLPSCCEMFEAHCGQPGPAETSAVLSARLRFPLKLTST